MTDEFTSFALRRLESRFLSRWVRVQNDSELLGGGALQLGEPPSVGKSKHWRAFPEFSA